VVHQWLRWDLCAPLFVAQIRLRPLETPLFTLLKDIRFVEVSIEQKAGRLWHDPAFRCERTEPWLCDELVQEPNLQLPVGSTVLFGSNGSAGDGRRCFRITLLNSALSPNDTERTIVQLNDLSSFQKLAASASSHPKNEDIEDRLEIPTSDRLALTVPNLIFENTMDALGPFLDDLDRGFPLFGLLCGSTGMGKTHTALVFAAAVRFNYRRPTLYLNCKLLQESTSTITEILAELDYIFHGAAQAKKSVVILDGLDRIAPNVLGGKEGGPGSQMQGANPTAVDQSKLVSDRILQLFSAANQECSGSSVVVIGTCASDTSLNESLCIDERSINIPVLNSDERFDLYFHFLENASLKDRYDLPEKVFSQPTQGFRPKDMEKVALRVRRQLTSPDGAQPLSLEEATEAVLRRFSPLSHIGLDKPRVKDGLSWAQIGGLFEVKSKLEATLLNPVKYRAIYDQAKIRLPRGILLFGPTGCGKTALVPALAEACQFPLISCKGPEVLDKYIGASEAKIRDLFKQAASVAPSILFLDELDALAPRRGSDHTGVTDRVVNQLLTFLDGVEDTSNATVYVFGASSRPDKIDPALLRPGRLEKHMFVGPPDGNDKWIDLVRKVASGWNLSENCRDYVLSDQGMVEITSLINKYPLLCPADIKAAMDTAQLNAVHRTLKVQKAEDVLSVEIEVDDLKRSLTTLRPCLNQDDARFLDEIYRRYNSKGQNEKKDRAPGVPQQLKTTLR